MIAEIAERQFTDCPILAKSHIDSKDTPASHCDVAMCNGVAEVIDQYFYVAWPDEGDVDADQSMMEAVTLGMGRMIEQFLASQVHRLQVHKDPLSPKSLGRCLKRLEEFEAVDPWLFVTPWSESDYMVDQEYDRKTPVVMSVGLPSIQEACLVPTRVIDAPDGKFYFDLEVPAGGPIRIGQVLYVGGRTYAVMSEPYPADKNLQRVHVDKTVFGHKRGDAVRVEGIGEYNLLMGDGVFTIISRPQLDCEGFTLDNGLNFNYYVDENGTRVLSLLFGLNITKPNHALVLRG